jgi:hypothetical protein
MYCDPHYIKSSTSITSPRNEQDLACFRIRHMHESRHTNDPIVLNRSTSVPVPKCNYLTDTSFRYLHAPAYCSTLISTSSIRHIYHMKSDL